MSPGIHGLRMRYVVTFIGRMNERVVQEIGWEELPLLITKTSGCEDGPSNIIDPKLLPIEHCLRATSHDLAKSLWTISLSRLYLGF